MVKEFTSNLFRQVGCFIKEANKRVSHFTKIGPFSMEIFFPSKYSPFLRRGSFIEGLIIPEGYVIHVMNMNLLSLQCHNLKFKPLKLRDKLQDGEKHIEIESQMA